VISGHSVHYKYGYGGGIYFSGSSGSISNCTVANNDASVGGGVYGAKYVYNCTIQENEGYYSAGGLYGRDNAEIHRSVIAENSAKASGGLSCGPNSIINNCRLTSNRAFRGSGGGVGCGSGTILNHCTITHNDASSVSEDTIYGGGVYGGTIRNSIVYMNTADDGNDNHYNATIEYSCTTPDPGGMGNITNRPLFEQVYQQGGEWRGNFHLQSSSPGIDVGNNSYVADEFDLDGKPRIINEVVDMGAYEFGNASPVITERVSVHVTMDQDSAPVPFNLTLHATDFENEILTWTVSSFATNGIAAVSGIGTEKVISYIPETNYNGTDRFEVQVSDESGGRDHLLVEVTIHPRNDAPKNTTAPAMSGTYKVGQALSIDPGVWNDADDRVPGNLIYSYQWNRADDASGANLTAIAGATSSNYLLGAEEVGHYLQAAITVTDDGEGLPTLATTTVPSGSWRLVIPEATPVPSWWVEFEILNDADPADDYVAANIGQLKYMAQKAYTAMEMYVPGGAGTEITALLNSFTPTDDYATVNVGQSKYVAKLFYDRLGLPYPWTEGDHDYSVVNIGQLKYIFSFEL